MTRGRLGTSSGRRTRCSWAACRRPSRAVASMLVRRRAIPPRDPAPAVRGRRPRRLRRASRWSTPPRDGDAVARRRAGGVDRLPRRGLPLRAAACRLTLARADAGPAAVTLRLDDPLGGPVLASRAAVACAGGRYDWHRGRRARSPRPATGRRDLYVVFDEPGTGLRDLVVHRMPVTAGPRRRRAAGAGHDRRRGPARRRRAEHGVLCAQWQAGDLRDHPAARARERPGAGLPPARRRAGAGQQPVERHRAGAAAAGRHAPAGADAVRRRRWSPPRAGSTTTCCWSPPTRVRPGCAGSRPARWSTGWC